MSVPCTHSENTAGACGDGTDRLFTIINNNEPQQLRRLLRSGFVLEDHLTLGTLTKLYESIPEDSVLNYMHVRSYAKYKHQPMTLGWVRRRMRKLTGSLKLPSTYYPFSSFGGSEDNLAEKCRHPFRDLFIHAILLNRVDMAFFLWREGNLGIGILLAACEIMRQMSSYRYILNPYTRNELSKSSEIVADYVAEITDFCFSIDEVKTQRLLIEDQRSSRGSSYFDQIKRTGNKKLIANEGYQRDLTALWLGPFRPATTILNFVLCLLCPLVSEWFHLDTVAIQRVGMSRFHQKRFFTIPVIKFGYYLLSYVGFLMLFSYVVAMDFRAVEISTPEWLVILYVFAIFIEESSLLNFNAGHGYRRMVRHWFNDIWKVIDLFCIMIFTAGLALRLVVVFHGHDIDVFWVHIMYCASLVMFYVRLLHICLISQNLGPKLVMIKLMVKDLLSLLVIILIFTMAYGVTSSSILYPNETDVALVFKRVFAIPYWQLYGELFLEIFNYQGPGVDTDLECTSNATDIANGSVRCPTSSAIPSILTAVYLLFANILLLNLLIAMFSYTFTVIQEDAGFTWKYYRYYIVQRYVKRPMSPPPFSAVEIALVSLWRRCAPKCDVPTNAGPDRSLVDFERSCIEMYKRTELKSEKYSLEGRVEEMAARWDKDADDIRRQVTELKNGVDCRLEEQSKKLSQVIAMLSELTTSIDRNNGGLGETNSERLSPEVDIPDKL